MQKIEFFLKRSCQPIFNFIDRVCKRKFFFTYLIGASVFFSLFSAFPSYDIAFSDENQENWSAILYQTKHPFTPVQYNNASHQANLTFRLTPVLIGNILHITSISNFLIFQFLCFVILLLITGSILKKIVHDPVVYSLLTLALSVTFVGGVLCSDYRGFFDVIAFMLLASAMYFKNGFLIVITLLLSYFTDERSLIASGLLIPYFLLEETGQMDVHVKNFFNSKLLSLIISVVLYMVFRWTLSFTFNLTTNTSGLKNYLLNQSIHQINLLPFGLWSCIEGFWILVFLSIMLLIFQKRTTFTLLYLFFMLPVIFVSVWVFDITRSMAYLFPIIFISLMILAKHTQAINLRYLALTVLLICFFPTYYAGGTNSIQWLYPLPIQLARILTQ